MRRIRRIVTAVTLLTSVLYVVLSSIALMIVASGVYAWLNRAHVSLIALAAFLFVGAALGTRGVWLFWDAMRTKRENMFSESFERGVEHE